MTQSEQYYDPSNNYEDFNDSIVIRPISLKPTVVPSILQRGNPQNTILATYDNIKLTEYAQSPQQGRVIQLINLQNSLLTILTPEGIEFFQRQSATDIAFVIVTGDKGAGKSFFIDKILNLSNVQGNNFSIHSNEPAINVWSAPFVKGDLTFFIAEVSGCSPDSEEFNLLLPYVTLLSSVIINIEGFKNKTQESYEKLNERFNAFLKEFHSEKLSKEENKTELLNNIFPKIIYKVNRNKLPTNPYQVTDIRMEQLYLPNAMNPDYRGFDQDLRVHSFLNKKCINEHYIQKVSEIFTKVVTQVQQKKHRELVFNGGIIMKYLGQLSLMFQKGKNIDIGKVYYNIVKDLYLSAYNYCVICYHEALEEALSDEKPRSLDQLIQIFQVASNQIQERYNQFSLEKSIHEEYQEKLQKHIESKQKLILQINKKKTDNELKRIYDNSLNFNDLSTIMPQIKSLNQKYPTYSHGRDQTIGHKLAEVMSKLLTGNNVDYRVMKEIQKLSEVLQNKNQELQSLRQFNQKTITETGQKNKKNQQQKTKLMNVKNQKERQIQKLRKQIKSLQQSNDSNPIGLKEEQKELLSLSENNQKLLEKLRKSQNEPENKKEIKQLEKKLEDIRNKILSQQLTLKALQGSVENNKNTEIQPVQTKEKKQNQNAQKIKDSKSIKKSGK